MDHVARALDLYHLALTPQAGYLLSVLRRDHSLCRIAGDQQDRADDPVKGISPGRLWLVNVLYDVGTDLHLVLCHMYRLLVEPVRVRLAAMGDHLFTRFGAQAEEPLSHAYFH